MYLLRKRHENRTIAVMGGLQVLDMLAEKARVDIDLEFLHAKTARAGDVDLRLLRSLAPIFERRIVNDRGPCHWKMVKVC
jgi:hypothetical protein